MENFGKFCAAIIMIVASTLMSAFVLTKLYGWFIVPIYGLAPITIPQAMGISTIISFLLIGITMNLPDKKDKETSFMVILVGKFIGIFFMYAVYLLMGYIISLYI